MKSPLWTTIFIVLLVTFSPNASLAGGFGIHIPVTFGTAKYDFFSTDENHFGLGFIFDTSVGENRVFNYRLNVSFEYFEQSHTYSYYEFSPHYLDPYLFSVDYHNEDFRLAMDNTFGFAVLRTRIVRLWLGPQVRGGFMFGDRAGVTIAPGLTVLGLNFNLSPVFTLGIEGGFRLAANLYFDEYRQDYYDDYIDEYYDIHVAGSSSNNELYLKLSFIFRSRDKY